VRKERVVDGADEAEVADDTAVRDQRTTRRR
jgi:hypothetical protein